MNATRLHATYRSPVFGRSYSTNLDHYSCTEKEFIKVIVQTMMRLRDVVRTGGDGGS